MRAQLFGIPWQSVQIRVTKKDDEFVLQIRRSESAKPANLMLTVDEAFDLMDYAHSASGKP
jgi:hypothetical protein